MDFKLEIAKLISYAGNLNIDDVFEVIEVPSNKNMGDYAYPCFKLAKLFKKSPQIIANDIFGKIIKKDFINDIKVVGGYINFFIEKSVYIKEVLEKVFEENVNYGKSNLGKNKTIVIDYSSPNIAKPFHVGHLRSTVIGNSLYNIYKYLGYDCIGINHLGDWGTQFGKLIVAYKNWGSKEAIERDGIKELMNIYVKFHNESQNDKSLEDEARSWFVKMQNQDEEAINLWKWFYDISIKEFERVYNMLGVKFDYYTGESFYNDKMDIVIEELKDKNLLKKSEGALIVDLEEYKMTPCLILRKDGGTLYATRDIAAAMYRKKEYNFEKCLYLTALDQNLHFAQWFKVIEKMGYEWSNNLVHIPFGLVSLDTGKLSTRQGNVVLMEELLNQAITETNKIIDEKNPNLTNKKEIAKQVGIGAVIFNDLYNNRIKDVVFSWERMLNFDGETGPYVQYTHARACSLIKKICNIDNININDINKDIDFSLLNDENSIEICKLIEMYPHKILDSANKFEPSVLTRHIVDISQAFNKFYHDNPIMNSEEKVKNARIALVYTVKIVIESGLKLLGISTPEQM